LLEEFGHAATTELSLQQKQLDMINQIHGLHSSHLSSWSTTTCLADISMFDNYVPWQPLDGCSVTISL